MNLYGNAGVTDAGLEALAGIATLREVYLWQTGVTAAGARAAARAAARILDVGARLGRDRPRCSRGTAALGTQRSPAEPDLQREQHGGAA